MAGWHGDVCVGRDGRQAGVGWFIRVRLMFMTVELHVALSGQHGRLLYHLGRRQSNIIVLLESHNLYMI